MNRKLVSEALTEIDQALVAEAMEFRAAGRGRSPERKGNMANTDTEKRRGASRRGLTLALAACLLLALAATAYALDLFGLRELYADPNRGEMPAEAQGLIEEQEGFAQGEGFSCRVTESYCDENNLILTLSVTAEEGYVLAGSDEDPDTELRTLGLGGEETLADYALAQHRKLLFVGASLPWEELEIRSESQRMQYLSDREMTLYLEAAKGVSAPEIETVCRISGLVVDPEEPDKDYGLDSIQRLEIPLRLREGEGSELGVYLPEEPEAVPGLVLGELTLRGTPLGITLRLTGTPTDLEALEKLLTIRADGLEFFGTGCMGIGQDGGFLAEFEQGRGELGDSLTVTFLDWDKQPVGTVTFVKK
ncbi:MAG: hypothetical protein IKH34_04605 [Oscillospiraceae bacterium]|nr:hypothetical protein [Oscillospiraceae bacterium]